MAFKPDGSELLVAADNKVLIYDPADGTQLQVLKGHKDLVYAVAWSNDGELFASGSADKSVIIWTEQHEGTLKYTHSEAIQCLAFCPTSNQLLSCAMGDFAMWSSTEKNVQKQRIQSRCTSCAWNRDGTIFAIGTIDGIVYIRKAASFNEDAIARIERPSGEPVWSLRFSHPRIIEDGAKKTIEEHPIEILAVVDWSKTISFYDTQGSKIIPNDKELDYEPSCMEYFNNDKFLVVGGSGKEATLYTRLGLELGKVCMMDTWIWCVAVKANTNQVYVGCVDGTLACYNLTFGTVHGLHQDRYAFRDNMTEVIVQHLTFHTMTRIKCNDCVKKVAIYGDKLAVQLSDRLHIYRQVSGMRAGEQLEFKLIEKINKTFDCSLLVVCAKHIILCNEQRLQCHDHKGLKQREWFMEALIRYIKVIGGPPGRETILVGLKGGQVCKIFVDNPFPVILLRLPHPIKCLDISPTRKFLAVVDEEGVCVVYDSETMEPLFQETKCNSVAFNCDNDNIICYSSDTTLTIRANNLPGFQQRMNGFVVGFSGNKVFCLHAYTMTAVEVPFSSQLFQYIETKQFELACRVATLGVTEEDWKALAHEALNNLQLDVARKAFARIRDTRSLVLIDEIKEMISAGEEDYMVQAHLLAYQKRYREVAALYREKGFENKAMELFTDLRMFDDAQEVMSTATGETQKILLRKRADWARDSNQPKVAAEMLMSSGDLDRATQLIIDNDWIDLAVNVMRKLPRGDVETLRKLADYFVRKNEYGLASKIYTSVNDTKALVQMHVAAAHWTDAFAIAERYPKYSEDVYLPYARHLAENDNFDEAQKAFHKAGRSHEALRVLEQLTKNAVNESRFADAGYYHWLLSMQYLDRAKEDPQLVVKYQEHSDLAQIYYAYDGIHHFCTYYTLARIGRELGAFKLAREALDNLQKLRMATRFKKSVDIMTLNIRAKPFQDNENLLPICYRCGLNNSLISGGKCVHCDSPFIFSFATFEVLPLVEIFVADDIPFEEAKKLIEAETPISQETFNPFLSNKKSNDPLNRDQLARLEKGHVIILPHTQPLKARFLYNMMPSIAISKCHSCLQVFHMDDLELAVLQKGFCPFCRSEQEKKDMVDMDDDI